VGVFTVGRFCGKTEADRPLMNFALSPSDNGVCLYKTSEPRAVGMRRHVLFTYR